MLFVSLEKKFLSSFKLISFSWMIIFYTCNQNRVRSSSSLKFINNPFVAVLFFSFQLFLCTKRWPKNLCFLVFLFIHFQAPYSKIFLNHPINFLQCIECNLIFCSALFSLKFSVTVNHLIVSIKVIVGFYKILVL